MNRRHLIARLGALGLAAAAPFGAAHAQGKGKEIAYITPSLTESFWRNVVVGIEASAKAGGYTLSTLDSNYNAQTQLQNMQNAIAKGVAGVVLSPVDSGSAPATLALAEKAGIPVVICDIGTSGGTYASFISSDNLAGARGIGEATAAELKKRGWTTGSYGLIAIPQTRKNGQLRTQGFREAMAAVGMKKEATMQQMRAFTADESFRFAQDMLTANADLRAIFVQTDSAAMGAFRAVKAARKTDSVLIAAFDGTPELLAAIMDGSIVGSGMQQPYLMGSESGKALTQKLGGATPPKDVVLPILTVTAASAKENMGQIKLNVFANKL